MRPIKPGIRGPRLPNIISRSTRKGDAPLIVGLDAQSSYVPGYNPSNGLPVTTAFILQESFDYLLQENDSFIMLE